MTEQVQDIYDGFYEDFEADASAAEDFGSKANFGKINIFPSRWVHWVDKEPNEVDAKTYGSLPTNNRSMDLTVMVDIQEFNPELDFTYDRPYIRIGGPDWHKTLKPSIENVMKKGSMSKGKFGTTLAKLNGAYVEVHDVPQQDSDEYNTPKIVRIFKNRDACFNAWQERFGSSDSGNGAPTSSETSGASPTGWDLATWQAEEENILAELAKGRTAKDIADNDYEVPVKFIVAIKNKD